MALRGPPNRPRACACEPPRQSPPLAALGGRGETALPEASGRERASAFIRSAKRRGECSLAPSCLLPGHLRRSLLPCQNMHARHYFSADLFPSVSTTWKPRMSTGCGGPRPRGLRGVSALLALSGRVPFYREGFKRRSSLTSVVSLEH